MISSIKLNKYTSHNKQDPVEYGLKVVATTNKGDISDKIFVWQSRKGTDNFICVASPCDLEEIPEDVADPAIGPYYRSNSIEMWFRNYDDFKFYSQRIEDKVRILLDAYNSLSNYDGPEEVII